jgi:F-type H+-transporting ATPase subunit b
MNLIPNPLLIALQFIPFFITLIGLYHIIFKPLQVYLDQRNDSIEGAIQKAASLKKETKQKIITLEENLQVARQEAAVIRNAAITEGVSDYNNQIAQEREAANLRIEEAAEEIAQEAKKAKDLLQSQANDIATDIAGQVLGRALA